MVCVSLKKVDSKKDIVDVEVIEVDELDEGNISATAENKTNYGRLS